MLLLSFGTKGRNEKFCEKSGPNVRFSSPTERGNRGEGFSLRSFLPRGKKGALEKLYPYAEPEPDVGVGVGAVVIADTKAEKSDIVSVPLLGVPDVHCRPCG